MISSVGRVLGTITGMEAHRLHTERGASIHDQRAGVIRAVQLHNELPAPQRSPTPPTVRMYMGQSYTHRRHLAKGEERRGELSVEFRYIHPDDRPLFCLSVTDCLVGE